MELKHKSAAANKNITCNCPVAGRWCEVEAGGWRTEDYDGQKVVVGRLPLNPLATCWKTKVGWQTMIVGRLTRNRLPRAASMGSRANWLADVCRVVVVVQKSVSSEVVCNCRFVRTTYNIVRCFTYVLSNVDYPLTYIQSAWRVDCSNAQADNNVQLSSLRQAEFSHMRSNINQHVLFRSCLQTATGPPDDCRSRREKRIIV